jgi:hypothetical protein
MLVKSILEEILILWKYLSYIPKGVMEKIKSISFKIVCIGENECEIITLFKWLSIVKPKEVNGRGLKNIHHFGKELVVIFLWRSI